MPFKPFPHCLPPCTYAHDPMPPVHLAGRDVVGQVQDERVRGRREHPAVVGHAQRLVGYAQHIRLLRQVAHLRRRTASEAQHDAAAAPDAGNALPPDSLSAVTDRQPEVPIHGSWACAARGAWPRLLALSVPTTIRMCSRLTHIAFSLMRMALGYGSGTCSPPRRSIPPLLAQQAHCTFLTLGSSSERNPFYLYQHKHWSDSERGLASGSMYRRSLCGRSSSWASLDFSTCNQSTASALCACKNKHTKHSAPHRQKLNVALPVHADTFSWPGWNNKVGGLCFCPSRNIHP